MTMAEDCKVETTLKGEELNRQNVEGYTLIFRPGKCAADKEDWRQPRSLDYYVNIVLNPMIARGEIDDGTKTPYDDRKLRFDKASFSSFGSILNISLGATNFKSYTEDINRSDSSCEKLQQYGFQKYGDPFAFFSRAVGITVLVSSQEGFIFVGERTNKEYHSFLDCVSGHLEYRSPQEVDLKEDLSREIKEEFGIDSRSFVTKTDFLGIYSHPCQGDTAFSFLVKTTVPENYFSSGKWMEKAEEKEHKSLFPLKDITDVKRLLNEGKLSGHNQQFSLMYHLRGALESLREDDFYKK